MDVVEALAAAVDIRIGTATVERELVAVVGPESQFQVVRSTPVVHDAAHAALTLGGRSHVNAVPIVARQLVIYR